MVAGRVTCRTGQGKIENFALVAAENCSKIVIFLYRKRTFMSLKGEMNAVFNDVDSNV